MKIKWKFFTYTTLYLLGLLGNVTFAAGNPSGILKECCSYSYEKADGTKATFCDASHHPQYSFEHCEEKARRDGATAFRWGPTSLLGKAACNANNECIDISGGGGSGDPLLPEYPINYDCGDKLVLFVEETVRKCAPNPGEAERKAKIELERLYCKNKCTGGCASLEGVCKYIGFDINSNSNNISPTGKKCDGGQYYEVTFKNGNDFVELTCKCDCCYKDNLASLEENQCSFDNPSSCGCDGGNLVKLSNFTATPTDEGISLNWNTETELDSQGFRIWRAIPDLSRYCGCSGNIEDYTQIQVLDKEGKPVLIPAKGSKTSGFDYSYLDEEAKPGIAYCYALEDVDSKGESKFYFEYVAFTPDGLPKEKK